MTETKPAPGSKFLRSIKALKDRRMAAMFLLALAAGLPFGAILGTLNAWLTQGGLKPSAIGAFSMIVVAYAFKFLWAPAFQTASSPFSGLASKLGFLGARRDWLILLQFMLAAMLALLAVVNPVANVGLAAALALMTAIASASHDIVLDAWRIEVARSEEDKDIMSALYQFGHRLAGLVTGFVALMLAARIGWEATYFLIALAMAAASIGTIIAPEPDSDVEDAQTRPSFLPNVPEKVRGWTLSALSVGWIVSFYFIGQFVYTALTADKAPSGSGFVRERAPLIITLCVLAPAIAGAVMLFRYGNGSKPAPQPSNKPIMAR